MVATPVARRLIPEEALNWITEEEAISRLEKNPPLPLYSISENGLDWVAQHFPEHALTWQINVLKNKIMFRDLLKGLFPDFYFRALSIDDIQQLSASDLSFPLVVKPSVGFFSIGVHIVHQEEDWQQVQAALQPEKLRSIFPESVLNIRDFIIEEYIVGEEYADTARFDYVKLANDLENPIVVRELDIKEYSVFGFVFTEASSKNAHELQKIFTCDLRSYIRLD